MCFRPHDSHHAGLLLKEAEYAAPYIKTCETKVSMASRDGTGVLD